MPKRKRTSRSRAKRRKQRKGAKPKTARLRRTQKPAVIQPRYRALVAVLMFLHMLKLIDEKTLNRIYATLSPKKAKRKRK